MFVVFLWVIGAGPPVKGWFVKGWRSYIEALAALGRSFT